MHSTPQALNPYVRLVNERWLEMAQRLFPPIGKRDGLPEGELKASEARLGYALPSALRSMYRTAGRRHDLHDAWDRLIPPKNLRTVNHALVFYEEHDRLAAWGIRHDDLTTEDPPVLRASNEPPFDWVADHDTVSAFFFTELLWTHARSQPCIELEHRPAVEGLEAIDLPGCHWDLGGCWRHGGLIVIEREGRFYVGATSEEELAKARA